MKKALQSKFQNDHESVSDRLKNGIDEILDRWSERVRKEDDIIKAQDEDTLRNALGHFLEGIAKIIATSATVQAEVRLVEETSEICKEHGLQRAALYGYTFDLVIFEYQILRNVIFEILEKEITLNTTERQKVLEAIDNGISEASIAFTYAKGLSAEVISREARKNLVDFKGKLDFARAETRKAIGQRDVSLKEVDQLKAERELRETFVVTLSHDLKTPLTAAKMSAELIIRNAEDSKSHVLLAAQIIRNLERTDKMIVDLLDASRINAGEKLNLEIEEVELNKLVTQTLLELGAIYGDRFKTHFENEIKGFWSVDALRRIIENLVTNAIKYGDPQAPIQVTVRTETKLEDKKDVCLSVHNKGNPINLEELRKLFRPFGRVLSGRSQGKRGWGLGLALVRGFAEAHGGYVHATSTQEEGTTFTVHLPRDSRLAQDR